MNKDELRKRIVELKHHRAGARKVLMEQAKRQVQQEMRGLDLVVSEAFHEAIALGVSKNELARWWGTKNFNTVQEFLDKKLRQ